jgi:FixJ family two-component response regulator
VACAESLAGDTSPTFFRDAFDDSSGETRLTAWEWWIEMRYVASDDDNHSSAALHPRAARETIVSKGVPSQSDLAIAEGPIVYVIDDDAVMREALSSLFRSVGRQVKVFSSAPELLQGNLADKPSCLVLDIRLPGVSGLDFQAELAKAGIHIPIIFMTGHGDIPMSVKAMKAGAVDFLTKPFRDQDMLDAVTRAIERDRKRRDDEKAVLDLQLQFESLTPREREVIALVTAGLMNKQIAAELGVSEITVKIHRGHVMRKMKARSLADLVRMAEALGIGREKR